MSAKRIESMLLDIFDMQKKLNKAISKDWKDLNFRLAYRIEAAEAIESLPWKWWKKSRADVKNFLLEIVDLTHFWASFYMAEGNKIRARRIAESIVYIEPKESKNYERAIECIDESIRHSYGKSLFEDEGIFELLVLAASYVGYGFEDIYRIYMGKNALNEIRRKHGYKEGFYEKYWDGVEDNEVMMDIAFDTKMSKDFYSEVLDKLEDRYRLAIGRKDNA